jgi:hypothetical protein
MTMINKTTRELAELGTAGNSAAVAELQRRRDNRAAKFTASGSKKDGKLLESLDRVIAACANVPAPVPAQPAPVAAPAAAYTLTDVLTSMSPEQLAALTPATIAKLAEIYA